MPKQIPKVGDVFTVPLDDGSYCIGQVIETKPIIMNSMTSAFYDIRIFPEESLSQNIDLSEASIISCQFVTRDLFNNGEWKRVRNLEPTLNENTLPYRETKRNGWIGSKVVGSGVIRMFLSAYYGIREWTEMKDPQYYEKLLFCTRKGPKVDPVR